MELLSLIDKLENLATQSTKVPLTGKTMVGAEKLLELVDQMRLAVPRDLQEALEILERREQIVNQSLADAKRIRTAADIESRTRMDESEIVKAGKKKVDAIIEEAEAQGRQLIERTRIEIKTRRVGADQYARETLVGLEEDVKSILKSIQKGVEAVTPPKDVPIGTNGDGPSAG